MSSIVEGSIEELFRAMSEFPGDSNTQEVDEVLGDISIIDEESIGTKASRYVMDFPDDSYLSLIVEDVMHDELSLEGQLVAHVEPMVEEDEQSSFGLATDLDQIDAQTVSKATILPYSRTGLYRWGL